MKIMKNYRIITKISDFVKLENSAISDDNTINYL